MKERILVTGAAGYIGSVCTELLLDHGYSVLAIDNLAGGKRELISPAADFVRLDLCNRAGVFRLFRDQHIDAVIHLAGFASVGESQSNPHLRFELNRRGSLNLLDGMIKHGVGRMVYSSSASVYGEPRYFPVDENHPTHPINPYGQSKLFFEGVLSRYALVYGLKYVSLRCFNVAGASARCGEDRPSESHLIPRLLDVALGKQDGILVYGRQYPTTDGTCVRDYVHVLDVAEAHLRSLQHLDAIRAGIFNVGSGRGYTVLEILRRTRRLTGHPIPVEFGMGRSGDPSMLVANWWRLSEAVGWRPIRSDVVTILRSAWQWRLAHPCGYTGANAVALRDVVSPIPATVTT